jgi:hypothetical protein
LRRLACGGMVLCLVPAMGLHAQSRAIDDLKGKIFDAHMAQQTFANGLKYCTELNGENFYFPSRDRVLNLEDYHRSLESLTRQHVFNPLRRRPWDDADAAEAWAQAQRQALKNKADCELIASLPTLEKELEELQNKPAAAQDKKN